MRRNRLLDFTFQADAGPRDQAGPRPNNQTSRARKDPANPDAAGRRARSSRSCKRSGSRSVLLAAARCGGPGRCRRGPALRGAGHCAARRGRHLRRSGRHGPLRAYAGAARRPRRHRLGGAGGQHRRRRGGGGLYPADPGRAGLRCPFRHAARPAAIAAVKRPVGWDRPVDTVPDVRLRMGGRGRGPAASPGARHRRTVDAGRLRRPRLLPVRAADQPVVLALRGRLRHRHLLRRRRADGHQPQQLPAVLAGDVDGDVGHPARRRQRRRDRRRRAGPADLAAAGEGRHQQGLSSREGPLRQAGTGPVRPRSTSLPGGGRRRRRWTVRGAAAAPR